MSESFDFDPVDRITAGAVGEPGQRVFFVQARRGEELVTLLAEKQQVQVLATTLSQLLEAMGEPPVEDEPEGDDSMALEQPLVPEWRIGPMAIEVDEERGLIVLLAEEAVAEDEDGEPETVAARARFVATPDQMRALSAHAERVCSAGRPRCQLCGFPMEPEGHVCPAQNGHRTIEA